MKTYAYGFPRLGANREFKKAVEGFWKGSLSATELADALQERQASMLEAYARVDFCPSGEITPYDAMLDTAIRLGFHKADDLTAYYDLCRGSGALEMTKWFNTNYHYLVTDFAELVDAHVSATPYFLGFTGANHTSARAFYIGPFTFFKLSKGLDRERFERLALEAAEVYAGWFAGQGPVHVEEPAFVLELEAWEIALIQKIYARLAQANHEIHVVTYYGSVDWLPELCDLPVAAIGLDFCHGPENLEALKKHGFPADKTLIAGVISGRNVWRTDLKKVASLIETLRSVSTQILVSNAAPLYHLPVSVEKETRLDPRLKLRLSFATEKLQELQTLAAICDGDLSVEQSLAALAAPNTVVRDRVRNLTEGDFRKSANVQGRREIHRKQCPLPLLPTTTIGSFPQTPDVRLKRAQFRSGEISEETYDTFVRGEIEKCIRWQEEAGLDVLVHGEFERTDMVEFFAQKLDGIATTDQGWIISYGTRVYRPPIISADISRPAPMTVKEIAYAQSLTDKPVKGMLTGPVTIIAWSFVREDIPIQEVAYQLALALQDEIRDYEKEGIKIVQVDEAALRERAPVKAHDWPAYFSWAVRSFNLATNTNPATQIHTHMCYSEFNAIVDYINQMDFDVISIEACRSRGDIVAAFENIDFQKQIGLGVWDIHSPYIPTTEEMCDVIRRALEVIPRDRFWINPDCGLKTRGWLEVREAVDHLVKAAEKVRKESLVTG